MSPLELAANTVNLVSIYLAARNHVMTWPIGILACALFGVLFFQSQLYADVTLQIFFIASSFNGWYHWKSGGVKEERPISRVCARDLSAYILAGIILAGFYGLLLQRFTDASLPFLDSMVLTFSIIAQLLLMVRKLETWYFWIIVNLMSIPLYTMKALYLTAVIYTLFLGNALWGWLSWKRSMSRATL